MSEAGSTGRLKKTCGRKVLPTSESKLDGVYVVTLKAMRESRVTFIVFTTRWPAASRLSKVRTCSPGARALRSGTMSNAPVTVS